MKPAHRLFLSLLVVFLTAIAAAGAPTGPDADLIAQANGKYAKGDYDGARQDFQKATEQELAAGYEGIARILALCPRASLRDGTKAVAYARRACDMTLWKDTASLRTLAAACSESGDAARAMQYEGLTMDFEQQTDEKSKADIHTATQDALAKYPALGDDKTLLSSTVHLITAEAQHPQSAAYPLVHSSLSPLLLADLAARQIRAGTVEKLNTTILPKVNFRDASIRTIIDYLAQQSGEFDTTKSASGKGVKLNLDLGSDEPATLVIGGDKPIKRSEAAITLHLTQVPLTVALSYVCQLGGLNPTVDLAGVDIEPVPADVIPDLTAPAVAAIPTVAETPAAATTPAAAPTPATPPPGETPAWNVRVEALMVAMPEEKFIALLPGLQDEAKIAGLVPQLLDAAKSKEMILKGFPIVNTKSGQRAASETIEEKRYATEYTPAAADAKKDDAPVMATAFETRNIGVTLEAEPFVRNDGERIDINIIAQDAGLLGFDTYSMAGRQGVPVKDATSGYSGEDQPQFFTAKTTSSLALRNGQYVLLDTHKLVKPEGYVEIFILHAVAKPAK